MKLPTRQTLAHPRGTAEIETMLVIPLLLVLITMSLAALKLGEVRIGNASDAEARGFHDATAAPTPVYAPSSALDPMPGLSDLLPQDLPKLPNRMHVAQPATPVTVNILGKVLPTVTIKDSAAITAPAWAYSCWPVIDDSGAASAWFTAYADGQYQEAQSINKAQYRYPLGLADSWPP